MPPSLDPVLTPAWTHPDPASLWFNTTDASAGGAVLAGGTFEFKTTANFGFYVLNQAGTVIQSDIWEGAYQGVFWVKVSADGSIAAGGGWLTDDYVGLLKAISVSGGAVLLNQQTGSRVNQIDLTPNGSLLAAGCGATYSGSGQQIYLFAMQGGSYTALAGYTSSNNSAIQSLALSADGKWLVAALYGSPSLILFQVTAAGLVQKQTWNIPSSSAASEPPEADVRHYVQEYLEAQAARGLPADTSTGGAYVKFVSITPDGSKFAAVVSGANGLFYFDRDTFISTGNFQWQYVLDGISTSSCLSISADGAFVVALSNGRAPELGHAYRVNDGGAAGNLAWSTPVEYWPNPSNRILGGEDALVAFGTGEPKEDGALTPGRYYVLDASSGAVLGKYATPQMNWPFQMSANGTFAIGGSDDGNLYGFNSRGNWGAAI